MNKALYNTSYPNNQQTHKTKDKWKSKPQWGTMTYPPDRNIERQAIITLDKCMEQMELKYVAVRKIKHANHLRELCLLTLDWTHAHTVERKSISRCMLKKIRIYDCKMFLNVHSTTAQLEIAHVSVDSVINYSISTRQSSQLWKLKNYYCNIDSSQCWM